MIVPSGVYKRKKQTKEHNRNISKGKKGKPSSFKGKHHSEESIAKMKISHDGHFVSEETKRKIREANTGKIHSKKMRNRYSKAMKGIPKSEEHKRKLSEVRKGIPKSEKHKRKIRKSVIKNWQNPDYAKKQIKAIFDGLKLKPTKPERRLRNRLNHLFPGEYKYVGDGNTFIGGKCPDFINVNGQKKIIELFGDYWHSKEVTGRTKRQEENQRIKHFAEYGFRTLIVWQSELRNIKRLKKKLIEF